MRIQNIHVKVRWAALAGGLAALLTALAPTLGVHYGPTLASALTAVSAVLAGYAAPGHGDSQDPQA